MTNNMKEWEKEEEEAEKLREKALLEYEQRQEKELQKLIDVF